MTRHSFTNASQQALFITRCQLQDLLEQSRRFPEVNYDWKIRSLRETIGILEERLSLSPVA